jgi:hypothetical protein
MKKYMKFFMTGCQKEEDAFIEENNMEYIDLPEIESNELWFMDDELNKMYYKAMQRFDSYTDLKTGSYTPVSKLCFQLIYNLYK